jgi:hypothetical protein
LLIGLIQFDWGQQESGHESHPRDAAAEQYLFNNPAFEAYLDSDSTDPESKESDACTTPRSAIKDQVRNQQEVCHACNMHNRAYWLARGEESLPGHAGIPSKRIISCGRWLDLLG